MMMKSVFWWRKPEYPEETTDLRQVTDETFSEHGIIPRDKVLTNHNTGNRRGVLQLFLIQYRGCKSRCETIEITLKAVTGNDHSHCVAVTISHRVNIG